MYPAMSSVLVVDDDMDGASAVAQFLIRKGHRAISVPNGREALAMVTSARPDVILLDVEMPNVNGWAMLQSLRADPVLGDTPVIMISVLHERSVCVTTWEDGYRLGSTMEFSGFDASLNRRRLAALRRLSRPVATSAGQGVAARFVAAMKLPPGRRERAAARILSGVDLLQVPERVGPLGVVTPTSLAAAHRAGVGVHVWTVNDEAEMERLLELGVDGIVTDRADRLRRVMEARGIWHAG